nr:immunoglobulin light chain junction region [Macaca mulatta]
DYYCQSHDTILSVHVLF